MLANEGMSTRAIAPIVGVKSDQTIRADLAATKVRDDHAPAPEPENKNPQMRDFVSEEILDAEIIGDDELSRALRASGHPRVSLPLSPAPKFPIPPPIV